jgi:hypothetical protein
MKNWKQHLKNTKEIGVTIMVNSKQMFEVLKQLNAALKLNQFKVC